MLRRCLACSRDFPDNAQLDWLRVGRRLAFDPARGRLWLICGWCGHWSLLPVEQRWEAVEELERLARDGATVLRSTPQVSLLSIGHLEALRVGRAPADEEAWWRYGRVLRGRRLRYDAVTRAGGSLAAAAATTGLAGFVLLMPDVAVFKWRSIEAAPANAHRAGAAAAESFERWFRYGRTAWRGSVPCRACGHLLLSLDFKDRGTAMLLPRDHSIRVRCQHCRSPDGWHVIAGAAAEPMLRRLLAYENVAGADDRQIEAAIQLVRSGKVPPTDLLSLRAPRETLIGLELLFAERIEARALGWEIAELQARWQLEEELAQIIDRELTPAPGQTHPGGSGH